MKSFARIVVIMLAMLPAVSFAQEKMSSTQEKKSPSWPEMKEFHTLMAATFHPSEEGNFAPLKEKSGDLLKAAKTWQLSDIPSNYKPEETKETLARLVAQLEKAQEAVVGKADDSKLKEMIAEAHETFHKIMGECKKTDK